MDEDEFICTAIWVLVGRGRDGLVRRIWQIKLSCRGGKMLVVGCKFRVTNSR